MIWHGPQIPHLITHNPKLPWHTFYSNSPMSQAFVKEQDEEWLHDIQPTMQALINYLTRQNNGIRVYEQKQFVSKKTNKTVYVMSNGLDYTLDDTGRWTIA